MHVARNSLKLHAGAFSRIHIIFNPNRAAHLKGNLVKLAIAQVMEQEIRRFVVGNEYVGKDLCLGRGRFWNDSALRSVYFQSD